MENNKLARPPFYWEQASVMFAFPVLVRLPSRLVVCVPSTTNGRPKEDVVCGNCTVFPLSYDIYSNTTDGLDSTQLTLTG